MAKICEICGKNIGMLGTTYTVKSLDDRFAGLDNRTACLECSDAISRTQDIVSRGVRRVSEKENYIGKLKGMLLQAIDQNQDIAVSESAKKLIEEADKRIETATFEEEPEVVVREEAPPVVATLNEEIYGTPVFTIHGCRGRHLFVFEDFAVIKTKVTLGSVVTWNATDGEKTIFYKDCVGLQYKEPGLTIGYLQLETASGQMNNIASNQFSENTFTYDDINVTEFRKVYKYILDKVAETKK